MADKYIHELKEFSNLLEIIATEKGIIPYLVEKDYWLMHVLFGLQQQHFIFNLKGGTSLSKGYKIINRFSEDIDIYIKPPDELEINPRSEKDVQVAKRKTFYDELAVQIEMSGIVSIVRDTEFDDQRYYRSGGIRLLYDSVTGKVEGVKEGILLEAGFDTVDPFQNLTISSWAYDKAAENSKIKIIDNRAIDVACYHPGYTFVEKLQTIIRKFRVEKETGDANPNFMRQYYDVYCLLNENLVLEFIKTEEYQQHKAKRIKGKDAETPIAENEALLLKDEKTRAEFAERYKRTAALYFHGQPPFEELLERIHSFLNQL